MDPGAGASDFIRPGHVFPLRARRGGVLVRTGQTEGSVDLARLAGLEPAGVDMFGIHPQDVPAFDGVDVAGVDAGHACRGGHEPPLPEGEPALRQAQGPLLVGVEVLPPILAGARSW